MKQLLLKFATILHGLGLVNPCWNVYCTQLGDNWHIVSAVHSCYSFLCPRLETTADLEFCTRQLPHFHYCSVSTSALVARRYNFNLIVFAQYYYGTWGYVTVISFTGGDLWLDAYCCIEVAVSHRLCSGPIATFVCVIRMLSVLSHRHLRISYCGVIPISEPASSVHDILMCTAFVFVLDTPTQPCGWVVYDWCMESACWNIIVYTLVYGWCMESACWNIIVYTLVYGWCMESACWNIVVYTLVCGWCMESACWNIIVYTLVYGWCMESACWNIVVYTLSYMYYHMSADAFASTLACNRSLLRSLVPSLYVASSWK